jgi:alginate O-acetyltransferase complex protein AlgI
MLFNSYTFLFLFLPVTLGVYHLLGGEKLRAVRIGWLVVASIIFYGYFKWSYLIILLASIIFNYYWSDLIWRFKHRALLVFGVAFNVLLLVYYKYAGLLTVTANELGFNAPIINVLLPIGISFFTFQQISFLVDTYKGEQVDRSFLDYCLFVTFFPQLIAGPIVHHKEMMPQFANKAVRTSSVDIALGLSIFIFGLFKKVVLADNVAVFATPVFSMADSGHTLLFLDAWIGTIAYTLQIYFDFSGYSDMAIGLGRMFGIVLPLNFNSPYKSVSIADFWRRWHMTLSRFLRDYLYIGLGGNRHGKFRRYLNLLLTMLIGGFWHGAGWNFLLWGGLHGMMLVIHRLHEEYIKRYFSIPKALAVALTLFCVMMAWVPFRAATLDGAWNMLSAMFGAREIGMHTSIIVKKDALPWILLLGWIALFSPNTQQIHRLFEPYKDMFNKAPYANRSMLASRFLWSASKLWLVTDIALVLIILYQLSEITEFIYFQF